MTKKSVLWTALLAVLLVLAACGGDGPLTDEPFDIAETPDGGTKFTNNADGYAITLPAGGEIDTELAAIRTAVVWDDVRLYIYAEETPDLNGQASYINYSNTFLNESRDMTVIDSGTVKLDGCEATCNRWTRRALSRVENDLANYACFDIPSGQDRVYTLYFKYGDGVSYEEEILPIAESFRTKKVSAQLPAVPQLGTGAGPALDEGAQAAFDEIFAPDAPLTWGLYSPHLPYEGMVEQLEQSVGYSFPIYLMYSGFHLTEDGKPMIMEMRLYDALTKLCPEGKVPELTLQTYPQDEGLQIYDVLDGTYDQFLHDYAADIAAFGRPVLFRLGNEMNGDWCTYCAFQFCRDTDIFLEFYRYIFDIFRQEGADNCIWVFNPNCRSFPNYKWNHELMYYPGDEYVNVVGMTAYNTGTYYAEVGEKWSTFDELYRDLYDTYVERYAQPLMITEFSCSSVGGDKPAWITDMFQALPNYPAIKAAVWWSSCDYDWSDPDEPVMARPYMLDENEDVIAAFRAGVAGGREGAAS